MPSTQDTLRTLLQYPIPHHLISRLMGFIAETQQPAIKNSFISWFAQRYQVNMQEALVEDPLAYDNFNAFFTRALKPGMRPIDGAADAIVCPADGAVSQLGAIQGDVLFQAKGHYFDTTELLGGSAERARPFQNGRFATIYLSPRDYHRVHMPFAGTLREMVYVPGRLFSVNTRTAENVPRLFARNERVVAIFDTAVGPMAVILVGAMIVASIETVWAGTITPPARELRVTEYPVSSNIVLDKGAEMGRFKVGSTAIVLFGEGAVEWEAAYRDGTPTRMGVRLGRTLR